MNEWVYHLMYDAWYNEASDTMIARQDMPWELIP